MKNILLIGLGRFGRHVAIQLNNLGHEVMAVDNNEERVNEVLPFVTNAQIGDSTNADFLKSLGIGNFDVCMVTIGGNFQNSLETTSLLKELGAKTVVSRAERDVQKKFLLRNGADEVVYPENRLQSGLLSGILPITYAIIFRWMRHMQFLKWKFRKTGFPKQSVNWISGKNSESILSPSGKTTKLIWQFLQIPYSSLVPHCLFSVNIKNFKNVSVCSFYFHNRFHRF